MARVTVLDSDGKPVKAPGGRDKEMHSVDARTQIRLGLMKGVYNRLKVGDETKNLLVAVRPVSDDDRKKERSDDEAKLKALQEKLSGSPETSPEPNKLQETTIESENTESAADEAEKVSDDDVKKEPGRKPRTRQPRKQK